MNISPEFVPTQVPARIADLAFSYLRPAGFHPVSMPDERPDFDQPTAFFPLEVVMANYGAVIFSVVARPAYGDGTVQDWAEFLARESKLQLVAVEPGVLGGLPCLMVESQQSSDVGLMRLRTALLEDGGRLLNLSIMAPEAIWPSVEPTLRLALTSFRLAAPRGTSTPLRRGQAAAGAPETAELAPAAPDAAEAPAAASASGPTPGPVTMSERDGIPVVAADTGAPAAPAELALADDAGALDPEHPMNARLRDNGAGLTPRVLETHRAEKYAVIGAGAIAAVCRVPFGWHAIDDGRRTLIFDAAGKVQVSVNLRRDDGDARALLREILEAIQSEQPQVEPVYLEFAAELPGLLLRNVRDGETVLAQAYLVRQVREDGLAHVARVTATEDDMARALNLAEIVMRSLGLALAAV